MTEDARLARHLPELIAIRRDIHAHPELGMEEARTSALVAAKLREWGLETHEGIGGPGVVATLRGKRPGQGAIGLRADMDALAMTEQTGLPHAAGNGAMHACGHDGHTAMLLGAARMLAEQPDFAGTVHFIFQPAEEGRGGAQAMLKDGLFERFPCDAVYGLHNMPGIPLGQFALKPGPMMAGAGRWVVTFKGRGGHGGNSPHLTEDLAVVQAGFVQALQGIVSRNVPALDSAVISVGYLAGGTRQALNVMPSEVTVGGTMRAFTPEIQALLETRIKAVAEHCAAMQGATAEVTLWWNAAPLHNHPRETEVMAGAARALPGASVDTSMRPVTGGEDFAFMLQAKPGAFIFMGNGEGQDLHTPLYDFNDAALPVGVTFWLNLVKQELGAA